MLGFWTKLSNLYCRMNDYDNALGALMTCIEEQIEHDSLYFGCARILYHLGRNEEALEAVERALGINDSHEGYRQLHREITAKLS